MSITFAELEDVPRLVELVKQFYDKSPHKLMEWEDEKIKEHLQTALGKSRNEFLILKSSTTTGEIQGCLIGVAQDEFFGYGKTAHRILWWMDEPHRKSRDTLQLLKAFEYWARLVGCRTTTAGVVPANLFDTEYSKLQEFHVKRGYIPIEIAYMKVL